MKNKHVYGIDLILVVGSLVILMFLVGYARPLVIAPLDEFETDKSGILFVIENAEVILIDDNPDFSSPEEYNVLEGLEISLKPGEYYWKAVGVLGSEIRTLTIKSRVDLRLKKIDGEGYGVVNAGNVGLNVDIYNGTNLIESVKLEVAGERVVEERGEEIKFVGGMKDD
jgi:hypothetical protein